MQAHQDTRLAEALAALVRQIETGDGRDPQGRELKAEAAFQRARALAEAPAAEDADAKASPQSTPPEYQTWRTGP